MKGKVLFYTLKKLGIQAFLIKMLQKILSVLHLRDSGLYRRLALKYEEILKTFLVEDVHKAIDLQHIVSGVDTGSADVPRFIWVMWWQGLEQAPDIIKLCVSQICKLNKNCDVRIIDQCNYTEYVTLPERITEAVQAKEISLAHLADIIRVQLLMRWGGVWVDSSLFITRPFDDAVFNSSFYSISFHEPEFIPTRGRWVVGFMVSPPNMPLFLYLNEFLRLYLKKNKYFVEYLLLDYAIAIAYESIPKIQMRIDNVPKNNVHFHALYDVLNEDAENGKACINDKTTSIFRLSWKTDAVKSINGKETTYGYLLRKYIKKL
ncbi:MAG: capsular polysaccharide synthesis protein [Lachnospiraceae bacterium]|nr:capsular polysaccharide synthesis protein [Lachnospiraceae bacterium]